jgi:hypothetical protein
MRLIYTNLVHKCTMQAEWAIRTLVSFIVPIPFASYLNCTGFMRVHDDYNKIKSLRYVCVLIVYFVFFWIEWSFNQLMKRIIINHTVQLQNVLAINSGKCVQQYSRYLLIVYKYNTISIVECDVDVSTLYFIIIIIIIIMILLGANSRVRRM